MGEGVEGKEAGNEEIEMGDILRQEVVAQGSRLIVSAGFWMAQGEHSRGHNNHRVLRWIEDETFSVYVDNLPTDTTRQWLWKVFSEIGRVRDIYLSHKVRAKNPLKFAFVRFSTREEVRKAIEHLHGWIVWGCKPWLTESRFKRSEKQESIKGNKPERQVVTKEPPENMRHENEGLKQVETGRKSYKDAVLNEETDSGIWSLEGDEKLQTLGSSKIYLDCDKELKGKLEQSLVEKPGNHTITKI
ncbi:hypothetical protein PIB30_035167 [Stylosanthes scabra]|uniref:RRM domain-containing protein n=1 Tax=Stylosanthes scabra TaxID=79078 RepID=A0ABU6YBE2_9FABA|nr:hypothetical protein [Stylosanthes scabra]